MQRMTLILATALVLYWGALYSAPAWLIPWLLLVASSFAGSACLAWALGRWVASANEPSAEAMLLREHAAQLEIAGDRYWASGATICACRCYSESEMLFRKAGEIEKCTRK